METGFDTTDVLLLHRSGQACVLPEGFACRYRGHQFRHRPGGVTDGMSSPQFTHAVAGLEAYGWALPAAVIHDGGYHDELEIQAAGDWRPFTFSKDECDQLLKELLDVLAGEDKARQDLALVIYEAVHLFGQPAFDAGRAAKGGAA